MKVKLVEVGDGLGTVLLPLPTALLNELGWSEGDEIVLDIPVTGGGSVILYKNELPRTKLVITGVSDKSRDVHTFRGCE